LNIMSKSQLYIGSTLLDFNDEINVKRSVNDYRDPELGGNARSYTLEIPLTRVNRVKLGFIDDIRSRSEVTEEARLVVNGMEVIKGKLRILKGNRMVARAIIEGNDWINDISGVSIADLDWSGDTHTFTESNISGSWTAGAGALYRYPLINFCELVSGDYGPNGSKVYPYDLYPMWNVEDIVTKLFLEAGYTLAGSGFFAGTFGRSLYVMSKPNPAGDDFITGKNLDVYVDDDTDNQDSASIGTGATDTLTVTQVVDIDAETEDEGSDFSTSTNQYTAPEDGTYRFQGQITVYSTFNRSPAQWTVLSNNLTFTIRKNGAVTLATLSASGVSAFDLANCVYDLDTGYMYLEAGDTVEMYVSMSAQGTNDSPGTLTAYLYLDAGATTSFLKNDWSEQNLWPGIGQTISPGDYLPDVDGVAFLKALRDFANLRFFVDRNNRAVYIETSDDFYGSTVVDWSDKIDYSEEPEWEVIASNYKETQRFKWKPDSSDKAYVNEVAANGVPYQKELVLGSEYVRPGVDERENPLFAATPLGDMPQIGHWGYQKVPRIFGGDEFVSAARPYPANRPKSWDVRLFEWKGMVALSYGNFDWHDDIEDASGTNYTTFPSVECPDMSDVYDDYLLKDWNRIEKNKILTCTLKLSPAEIQKFMTVVGTAANEGFRAVYKLNVEGVDMLFICSQIVTDGDRVKGTFIQKM
jgi:hypothetical protein